MGVFRQNKLFHVIQHGKTRGNHRGYQGKMKNWEKTKHPKDHSADVPGFVAIHEIV